MKLAITGCNGSVGQRVVLLALKRGHTVIGIDLVPTSDELSTHTHQNDKFTFHQIDLKDYDRVLEILQRSASEAVVHLAAFRNPTDYQVQTHNSNVVLSWNILRACAELGITRVAQASSVNIVRMVFSVETNFQWFPLDENHPCEPDEPYGLSKLICEAQADTITRRYPTLRVASIRLHWAVPTRSHARRGDPKRASMDLWGYVQQDSAADAFLLAITCDTSKWSKKHEAFFIAAPETAADEESEKLMALYQPGVPVREGWKLTGRKGFIDCAKAERMLGWVHKDVPE
ncbi:NAD(P)-binding protein [Macrolepiota fuliginosa MF-IS2]|uniref:NAD(P)-binding protein n=1 Tax=Macrolepiota fuliginosa MF-IS2 TaxID=1400762 RepID=A0A9P6C0I7_9AGAR|nr:NAD(P)-binding protein [Macrolepiota fuliginosa MF-IS2]